MKIASLKINTRAWLPALSILGLLTSSVGYTAHRESIPSPISSNDRDFIACYLKKIAELIERADCQLREFFDERNSECYRTHVSRFGDLLAEMEHELISPLQAHSTKHESFHLAHEILLDLQQLLRSTHTLLKQHASSRPVALGLALQKLAHDFMLGEFRKNLEHKIETLTVSVESIACHETNCLKRVIINLYENNPLKDKDRTTILRCLSHRLGCR